MPKNFEQGKRHVTVATVKFFQAQDNQHSNHPGTKSTRATINKLEKNADLLGPKQVSFHSQDDTVKVALGLPAANKQVPILMHMEYEVRLPGHNIKITPMHKLISSAIGTIEIKEKAYSREAVTYSGTAYVAIRSAKNSTYRA